MTTWTPTLEGRDGPTYKAIADALAEAITVGVLAAGTKLPTHRDLAWRLGVTVTTVTRAYQEARRRGLIEGEVGRGTFVRTAQDGLAPLAVRRFNLPPLEERASDALDGPINLSLNFPPLLGQEQMFAETLQAISRSNIIDSLLTYQADLGMPAHRAAAAEWMRRHGMPCTTDSTMITNGGQHAMLVAMMALARPGDVVLTEPLTYPGMKALASQLDLKLVPVAMDHDGLRPDSLEDAVVTHGARVLYTMPTLHNPVSTVMPEHRRAEVAAVAERHGIFVIEDDVYGSLPSDRTAPLASRLPTLGVYLNSCSKSMAPGLRIGFIAAPAELMGRLAVAGRASCWMATPLTGEIMRRWVEDGTAEQLTQALREDVSARRAIADAELPPEVVHHDSHPFSYHLWLPLPSHWRAESFVDQLHRQGVIVLPAETFAVGRARPEPGIRVCIGTTRDMERMRHGLRVVARALQTGPDHLTGVV